jgi:hypothetical protein
VTLADDARIRILLADFANSDSVGKVNVIGAAWQVTARLPTGLTPALTLVVLVNLPPRYYGEQFAFGVSLYDEPGDIVRLPLPGPVGEAQALRIQQVAKAERPNVPGVVIPSNSLPSQTQFILSFPGGLLLTPGLYYWQVEIDGNTRPDWRAEFLVAGPPPAPVVG